VKKALFVVMIVSLLFSFIAFAENYPDTYFAKTRMFINYLSSENFSSAYDMFDSKMAAALPSQKLEALWKNIESQVGKIIKIEKLNASKSDEYVVTVATTEFQDGYLDIKLVFDTELKIAGLWITKAEVSKYTLPNYVDLSKFTVEKIEIGDKWKLPAELTIPKGKGPFVGVVMIPGSGPSDMNETIGENEPFKDIAYALSTMGFVVLRYDKRAYVYGKEMKVMNVQSIYLQDAAYAIKYLVNESFVSKVFLLGHSLGAYLLPEIAKENPEISGLVMLAPPARPLAEVMEDQLNYILKLSPSSADEIKKLIDKIKLIESHKLPANEFVMGAPASYYYELEKYAPIDILKGLNKPVLICKGGKDYQVPEKDFKMFKEAFGSNSLFTFKWYPNLSHIFTPISGIPSPLNYQEAENVSQQVVEDVANWIKIH
jgi:alpha-beta hydrolase superfamily lysophospholipase